MKQSKKKKIIIGLKKRKLEKNEVMEKFRRAIINTTNYHRVGQENRLLSILLDLAINVTDVIN